MFGGKPARSAVLALLLVLLVAGAARSAAPADPLNSPLWDYISDDLLTGGPIIFDNRVKLIAPIVAEDQRAYPIAIDARAFTGPNSLRVTRIVVIADLNPFPLALDYEPMKAEPFIATRIKLEQATPIRAAVQLNDGSWRVSGAWVDAAGGGCSAPPKSRISGDWAIHLGQIRGVYKRGLTETRLHVSYSHPMDTGLIENIPAFYIQTVEVRSDIGALLARASLYEPIAEDPALTLLIDPESVPLDSVIATARDTDGNEYKARIPLESSGDAIMQESAL